MEGEIGDRVSTSSGAKSEANSRSNSASHLRLAAFWVRLAGGEAMTSGEGGLSGEGGGAGTGGEGAGPAAAAMGARLRLRRRRHTAAVVSMDGALKRQEIVIS
jgi:hypothetical protein